MELATFGAGCFWSVEETFRTTEGVIKTAVGFSGGDFDNPSYEDVCYRNTGHAEVVHLEFDPSVISYEQLLDIFWTIHNPTLHNRQGPDVGSQYRSVIFYHTEEQKKIAQQSKEALEHSGKYRDPIVTEIVPAQTFWRAEEYHQKYVMKKGGGGCRI